MVLTHVGQVLVDGIKSANSLAINTPPTSSTCASQDDGKIRQSTAAIAGSGSSGAWNPYGPVRLNRRVPCSCVWGSDTLAFASRNTHTCPQPRRAWNRQSIEIRRGGERFGKRNRSRSDMGLTRRSNRIRPDGSQSSDIQGATMVKWRSIFPPEQRYEAYCSHETGGRRSRWFRGKVSSVLSPVLLVPDQVLVLRTALRRKLRQIKRTVHILQ